EADDLLRSLAGERGESGRSGPRVLDERPVRRLDHRTARAVGVPRDDMEGPIVVFDEENEALERHAFRDRHERRARDRSVVGALVSGAELIERAQALGGKHIDLHLSARRRIEDDRPAPVLEIIDLAGRLRGELDAKDADANAITGLDRGGLLPDRPRVHEDAVRASLVPDDHPGPALDAIDDEGRMEPRDAAVRERDVAFAGASDGHRLLERDRSHLATLLLIKVEEVHPTLPAGGGARACGHGLAPMATCLFYVTPLCSELPTDDARMPSSRNSHDRESILGARLRGIWSVVPLRDQEAGDHRLVVARSA